MRKLEGVVKEIVDELNYLKRREAKMRDTNGSLCFPRHAAASLRRIINRIDQRTRPVVFAFDRLYPARVGRLANHLPPVIFQIKATH